MKKEYTRPEIKEFSFVAEEELMTILPGPDVEMGPGSTPQPGWPL